ncbi:hypothetical protein [Paenibacillus sp. O199]|uniref:hypothetical protein n=1 Tax=Paenibacillus sp. O199 TaxID=1643925 RepID=UPI0007BF641B|nr:hypothetical protein [Paenibacillus sp. O199]
MINQKKLEMAFKRYSRNFIDGIKLEDVQKEYNENLNESIDIVESNETDMDHVLLINLDTISSYYLSRWKNDVLINKGDSVENLKTIQKVVFYQCMVQDLYKERYPDMILEYSFKKVVIALIHFTMFGWEKEEKILFNFLVTKLGTKFMDANDWNKHLWFLLELYLQFRDETISGTNQELSRNLKKNLNELGMKNGLIPEDLEVYEKVLGKWRTVNVQELITMISEMSLHHSNLAAEVGQLGEFGDFKYAFYPYEILFLLHMRKKQGLPNPDHFDDFLMNTAEAKMSIQDPETYPEWDPMLRMIDDFYRKNYPEYIPNQHGDLFQ